MKLGIDVATRDVAKLCRRLNRLASVISATDGGVYWQDQTYSQVHVETSMTEEQLDEWLYNVCHGADYYGTFSREAVQ